MTKVDMLAAGALLAAAWAAAIPVPLDDPPAGIPDLIFGWPAIPAPVDGYVLYYGQHYPVWTNRSVWGSTNAYVTNAPPFHTDYWVTAIAGTNESVPSPVILTDNGFQFRAVTVTVQGTGDVFQASALGMPWIRTRTNFHGTVGVWTNPVVNQFFRAPGTSIAERYWNL